MKQRRIGAVSALLLLLFAAAVLCGLAFGSVTLPPARIAAALRGDDRAAYIILFELRLPRVLGAGLAGVGLSLAGCLLQAVTDNDLCAPNIIGVNAGAGFAVMLTVCLFPMLFRLLPLAAFVGALFTTCLVLAISYYAGHGGQKTTIVLAGVAVSSLFNAGISFLSLRYPDALTSYTAFSVGGFSGVALDELALPTIIVGLCLLFSLILAPRIELLCLGDEGAAHLGVAVRRVRMVTVILASALCAAVVSYAGLLGFVGLIVPHVVRRILRVPLRARIPCTVLCGAVLVIFSDLLGRVLFAPWELPAGIIMAFIGAPFFVWLLLKRTR